MNETAALKLTVHILKEGKSYCEMPGVPGEWPEDHLYISFQDHENAKEANCPSCLARRDSGQHLFERLNGSCVFGVLTSDMIGRLSPDTGALPEGVSVDASGQDAFEEKTGQSAHFDQDLGRWTKIG